jgi:hypothetical protein
MAVNDEINKIKEMLEDHERRIRSLEGNPPAPRQRVASLEGEANIDELARRIGVDSNKIMEVFDIEQNSLTLVKAIEGNDIQRTRHISLLVLLGYKHIFNSEDLLAGELRRNVAENGVPLDNFSTSLDGIIPSLVRRKGEAGSHKTTYKLTNPGEAQAADILKKLCE